jgi:antitoxin ParD1/3/4
MPTRNVNLTEELDRFVAVKVKDGRYENASEVVRAGLRALEREDQEMPAALHVATSSLRCAESSTFPLAHDSPCHRHLSRSLTRGAHV